MTIAKELGTNLIQRVNLADTLRRSAALYQKKLALVDEQREISYADLDREVNRAARGLLERGIERGDFVGLIFRNCIDFFIGYYACGRIGATALPMNPRLTIDELTYIVRETHPHALVVQGDYGTIARELREREPSITLVAITGDPSWEALRVGDGAPVEVFVDERDAMQCLFTSGTTANPKGVMLSHVSTCFTALSAAHHMRVNYADNALVVMPIHHVGGLNDSSIVFLTVGATTVLVDGWNAKRVADRLQEFKVTATLLTAPMWIDLMNLNHDGRYDWTSMRSAIMGIATLPPERAAVLRTMCPNAVTLLASGQTEFCGYEEGQRPEHQHTKPLAWGDPTLMTDIAIMDDEGRLLPPGEPGEIVYRGPQAMSSYFGPPELTDEAFAFGWFHSGDLGYLDEDHTVFFLDRKKDMIKTGGENVASVEVTEVLLGHAAVLDCAVVGLPHERWTEAITGFVLLAQGAEASEGELIAHCKQRLAGFKVPKRVLVVEELPKTASGKVQKVKLRETYAKLYS